MFIELVCFTYCTNIWSVVIKLLVCADCLSAWGVVDLANSKVIFCECFKIECSDHDFTFELIHKHLAKAFRAPSDNTIQRFWSLGHSRPTKIGWFNSKSQSPMLHYSSCIIHDKPYLNWFDIWYIMKKSHKPRIHGFSRSRDTKILVFPLGIFKTHGVVQDTTNL